MKRTSTPPQGGGRKRTSTPPQGGGSAKGIYRGWHYPPLFPPPWWGRVRVGGQGIPTPTPTLPHKGGGRKRTSTPPQGGREKKDQHSPTRGEGEKRGVAHPRAEE